jgi:DNA-binding transcriptional LysR family regulator
MDQRRLEYFVALARELNFTRAAQQQHVTQSTLSAAIKGLESELGATLFVRSTRAVALTEAGWAFLPRARSAIEALDRARASVDPALELRGDLTVGMLGGLTVVDVPALAGEFHRRHPRVRLHLETSRRGTAGLLEEIKRNRVDVAFVGASITDEQLRLIPIKYYDPHLVVAADHPFADQPEVSLSDLAGETFVDMPLGFGQRAMVDEALAARSLRREVSVEVTDLTTVPDFVAHQLGVALLPPELVQGRTELRAVPISDADLSWTLYVVTSAIHAPSRSVHAFLDLVHRFIRQDRAF